MKSSTTWLNATKPLVQTVAGKKKNPGKEITRKGKHKKPNDLRLSLGDSRHLSEREDKLITSQTKGRRRRTPLNSKELGDEKLNGYPLISNKKRRKIRLLPKKYNKGTDRGAL